MENQFSGPEKASVREEIAGRLKEIRSRIDAGELQEAFDSLNDVGEMAHQAREEDLLNEIIDLSEEVKAQLRSKEQSIEYTPETIKNILKDRVEVEKIPHFKSVIERAGQAFENALNAETPEAKKESLQSMIQAEGYLGEKYRDDKDQRAYIKALNKGIEYLENM